MYEDRNECDGARSGRVLWASHPIEPTMLWYFFLWSMKVWDVSSLSDSGHALMGKPKQYGVASGVTLQR